MSYAQIPSLRAGFAYALSVCESVGIEPLGVHIGQTHGYYELTVQVRTADEVDTVAQALGIPADPERDSQDRIVKQHQEPWTDGAVVLPLARPGTLYAADRVEVVAYGAKS